MKQYRYLLKNIGLLSISSFGTKILTFLLIPLYTNILTTEEYGIYDMFMSTISLLIPILTINIMDAVMRFAMDEKSDKKTIFSIALRYQIYSMIIISILLIINYIFNISLSIKEYTFYFWGLFFSNSFYQLMIQFVKGLEEVLYLSIAGIINTVVMLTGNIIFLIYLKRGLSGYFDANILANLIPCVFLCLKIKIWKFIGLKYNKKVCKNMKEYCRPLILNSISWWINNVSDRYIVIWFCGVSVNGIYSIAYKIPTILNIIQNIIMQAWQISAVRDFDKNDKDGFFSKMYEAYNFFTVVICSGLIVSTKVFARLLYAKDFYEAWKYTPFLLISIVFGAMSGYIGGIFSAVKDSKIYSYSTMIGALSNIMLNIFLVKMIGAMGAAIATMISYFIVWQIRILNVKKYMKLDINLYTHYLSYSLLVIQSIIMIISPKYIYILQTVTFILLLSINCSFIKLIIENIIFWIQRKGYNEYKK
jgi:O-antigen/teichoic acid export membrane protein